MATKLARIIKYGFQNFWRNGWLSAATTLVMMLALFVFAALILFSVVTKTAIQSLEDKIDISVYFKTAAKDDDMLAIERAVKTLPEVKAVAYVSREKALALFKERHKADPTIAKALEELNDNPLSATLNIKAKNPKDYGVIAAYLENKQYVSVIEKVTYSQNQIAINRLVRIVDAANSTGIAVIVALALIAVIVTFNTIRLAIYSNRDEIGVMRLVGASNAFIRGPYVVEGIIYGTVSAVVAMVVIVPMAYIAAPYVATFIPEMNLAAYLYTNIFSLLGYELLFGVALGTISGSIAITRYLKV
ncbi:MAG: ABC transporter permease [Candidatus Harrisonbacteria bacterium]|nr:ABC transporter permease [Candidatus Harrisonbacteria bacterium]MBI2406161.1 ABC transporter permease [Candidatus Harrisonbacteria bacterium]MBI2604225.1 ABC transporter permease [Candidatus Harrisonbacteria bacterium]